MRIGLFMCGFSGIVNFKENVASKKNFLIPMNEALQKRGPDECGYYTSDNALLRSQKINRNRPGWWKAAHELQVRRKNLYNGL